jgi:beta-galactosidase
MQPQYQLAWRRFQAEQTTEFIGWQADVVREYAGPEQFVTTCLAYDRPALDDEALGRRLDVTAGNPYYAMQDGLAVPDSGPSQQGWTSTGTWAVYLSADRMFSSRQEPFLVTETNAHSIGYPWDNRPAYDGQWRQAAWALVSRGATMIEYWHWHTLHFGTETYWGGVLPHNGRPGRTYQEIARIGDELRAAGDLVGGLTPDADIAMVYSMPSKWVMQSFPPLATDDGGPDERAYHGLFDPFYRGAFDAGLQVRILHAAQLGADAPGVAEAVRRHPVLVAAGLYIAADATLEWLAGYAAAGGHLVLGPRTGYADEEARARTDLMPAHLAEPAGVWYDEYTNLSVGVPVIAASGSALELPPEAAGTRWIDGLQPTGAEILAGYQHPHFGRWPAITTRAYGQGRITYVGTVPSTDLAAALFRWLVPAPVLDWSPRPPSVTVSGATSRDGRRVRFVHNWSWQPATIRLPVAVRDVLSDRDHKAGHELSLGAWDVKLFVELRAPSRGDGPRV